MAFLCGLSWGWVLNFIEVVHLAASHAPIDAMLVLRGLGIFAVPLGAALGFWG